jgi:hypothetical protein
MKGVYMKRKPAIVLILLLLALPAFTQTAAELEQVLDTGEIACDQTAYFTLASALENPPGEPLAAFNYAREQGWFPKNAEATEAINMGALSLLMTKAFDIPGSLMYRFFPNVRYAYREMTNRGFIRGRSYPKLKVSGENFLHILGRLIEYKEQHDGTN